MVIGCVKGNRWRHSNSLDDVTVSSANEIAEPTANASDRVCYIYIWQEEIKEIST